jgi:hypothetical protein
MDPCFECGEPATIRYYVVPQELGGTRTLPFCASCYEKIPPWLRGDRNPSPNEVAEWFRNAQSSRRK